MNMLPLHIFILRELRKNNGTLTDKELYRIVRKIYNENLSFSEFNKMLMTLEIRGKIIVEPLKRNLRIIRLAR